MFSHLFNKEIAQFVRAIQRSPFVTLECIIVMVATKLEMLVWAIDLSASTVQGPAD